MSLDAGLDLRQSVGKLEVQWVRIPHATTGLPFEGPAEPHELIEQQAQGRGYPTFGQAEQRLGLRVDFQNHSRPESRFSEST